MSKAHTGGSGSDAAALIHTLVELGRILGMVTLAEGIEEPAQLLGLRAERCDAGQGYLFSRPVPADEIDALLDAADDGERVRVAASDAGRP